MKEINYKGKKVKVPFEDADYTLDGDKDIEIQNKQSGAKATVPGYAAAVYDVIIGAESLQQYDTVMDLNLKAERKDSATGQQPGFSDHQDDWQKVRNGINFFRQYFAKEYMVLLD